MENPILARLSANLGVSNPDPYWLLTLLSVLEVNRYTLEQRNEALSVVLGRRILCPSYRTLSAYLQKSVLGLK